MRVLPLLVVLLLLAACSKSAPAAASTPSAAPGAAPAEPAQQQAAAPEVKPVPAQLPDVLARVNGEAVNKDEFERAISDLEARAGGSVPAEQRDRIVRGLLDEIIAFRLLLQESRVRNIVVPDADVDKRVGEIRQQFPSEEAFTQTLEQRKMTLAGLRSDAREGMQIDKLLAAEMADKVPVKPEEITDFYQKNPDQFQQAERVHASHILIRFPQNADAAAKQQAHTKAADVLKDVKAGKDFAALAKEHSQDPGSAVNGGDLGFFEHGQMVGPFEEAAFSLAPGQASDIVETTFGYHIVKVIEKQAPRTVPLDEVRPQIEQFLENRNRQQQMRTFVDSLRAKGKIEIFI